MLLGKVTMMQKTLFCRSSNFNRWVYAANSQVELAYIITDLMRALWRVSLMLVLNHSLLNRECNLINDLQALVPTVSISRLHVIFLLKHYKEIFYTICRRNAPSIQFTCYHFLYLYCPWTVEGLLVWVQSMLNAVLYSLGTNSTDNIAYHSLYTVCRTAAVATYWL
jgi:hypothetical protein